ncbi:MAG: putative potassium transport system protein kup [Pseudomonadota bacterium]|jgi:KUP system potassium uptake protein
MSAVTSKPSAHEHKTSLQLLVLGALGVVYGDIGTSPLYAFKELFAGNHPIPLTEANVFGGLSMIFWALMIIVSLKYIVFILRADNRGEGGMMALIALALHEAQGNPKRARWIMLAGILGTAMFYGDGMITPAISVLSAVEGLEIVAPQLHGAVIPVTLLILIGLFMLQKHGTAKVGTFFGPVMGVWFAVLGVMGIYNVIDNPHVLLALNPAYAIHLLVDNPHMAVFAMGSVVLAVTGAEALYADMGHFGRKPIRLAWAFFVLPALVINYFGQAALVLGHPEAIDNPFFMGAPESLRFLLVCLATCATVIASQAVITGAYSMTRQAMQLGFVPRMLVQHTSEKEQGQIYMPGVNWLQLSAVILLVLTFKSSNNLAAAYGLAVTGDMVITSLLAVVVAAKIWHWGWYRAALLFACFLVFESIFLWANIQKIPDGGWFPLVAGFVIFIIMTTWKRGRDLLRKRLRSEELRLDAFVSSLGVGGPARVPGIAVFLNGDLTGVPHALLHNMMHNKVLHEKVLVTCVQIEDVPFVPETDRVEIKPLKEQFWTVLIRYGFKEEPNIPEALARCGDFGLPINMMETSFFLGRETLIPKLNSEMAFWREKLFITMYRNADSATNYFNIPTNRVVELGTQVAL